MKSQSPTSYPQAKNLPPSDQTDWYSPLSFALEWAFPCPTSLVSFTFIHPNNWTVPVHEWDCRKVILSSSFSRSIRLISFSAKKLSCEWPAFKFINRSCPLAFTKDSDFIFSWFNVNTLIPNESFARIIFHRQFSVSFELQTLWIPTGVHFSLGQ